MKLLLIVSITLFPLSSFSQTQKIEGLKAPVMQAASPHQKLIALLTLCTESSSMNIDTLYHYALWAKQLAKDAGNETERISADLAFETWLDRRNLFDSALAVCSKDIAKLKYTTPWDLYAQLTMKKGVVLIKDNRRKDALDLAFKFLGEAETKEDTISQVYCKYLISAVYRYMQQTEPALQWALKAENTGVDTLYQEKKNAMGVYFIAGMMYNWKVSADTLQKDITRDSLLAVQYLNRAITYSRRYQNLPTLARALCIMCDQTEGPEHSDFAEKCLQEGINIYNQLGDTVSILNSITALSNFYVSLHQPQKGIEACLKGLEMTKRGNAFPVQDLYWTLGDCYKAAGDYANYAKTLRTIIELKDTIYKRNSESDLAAFNAKYDDVKKENTIIQQKYDITRKNYLFYGSLILLALAATVFYLLFKEYRRKQKIRVEQMQAEEKRLSQKAVVAAEENQRKRIAADLHDNLGSQANAILYGTEQLMQGPERGGTLVNDLHDTAKDMLLSLRETLWAMKTADVTLMDVWLRIINFSMQMKNYYRTINIITSGTAPQGCEMSAAKALHAILIIQEAVNNAVRHASAASITIQSSFKPGGWQIKVSDDGKGFDLRAMQNKEGHYGLANMQERAAAAGIAIAIETAPQQGTDIIIDIPVISVVTQDAPNGVFTVANN